MQNKEAQWSTVWPGIESLSHIVSYKCKTRLWQPPSSNHSSNTPNAVQSYLGSWQEATASTKSYLTGFAGRCAVEKMPECKFLATTNRSLLLSEDISRESLLILIAVVWSRQGEQQHEGTKLHGRRNLLGLTERSLKWSCTKFITTQ